MSALGFDIGTKTGWAASVDDIYECGLLRLPGGRFPGDGLRTLQFETAVLELIARYKPTHIYYELVRAHQGVDAAHVYGALRGTLTKICEQQKLPYSGIPVGTIKKFATGNGGAKKEAMLAVARAKWPHLNFPTDDVADAIWILETGLNTDTTQCPTTKKRKARSRAPSPRPVAKLTATQLQTRLNRHLN